MFPRAVVFDLGKVLIDVDYRIAARAFARRSRFSPAEILALVDQSPLLHEFETGLLTNQQFYHAVGQTIGYNGDYDEFAHAFADIFSPIDPMIQWHARLRAAGIPTYIFSNTNNLAVTHIRRTFPFFAGFDGYIYSYEQRAMKPDPKIYEALERMAGCHGPELLYLDDRIENADAGRARCWQVIVHATPEQTLPVVERLLPLGGGEG